ncbi:MAG: efflux RND transporter permease subunit [Phycisphaerae bacterium]
MSEPEAKNHDQNPPDRSGVLAWFATNHVATNLLMAFILLAGAMAVLTAKYEVFQEFDLDRILVTVPYPGAAPDDIVRGINERIEDALDGIDGVKRVQSLATEGLGSVTIEIEEDADDQKVKDDVEQAIDTIQAFPPEDAEQVRVTLLEVQDQVINVVLYGDVPEKSLKAFAERTRDELTALDLISVVNLSGARPYEISIEVSERALRKYGLTFDEVARIVRANSLDLPGGTLKTGGGEILLRTQEQRYVAADFENLVLLARNDGTKVTLKQVADIDDSFADSDNANFFDGRRSMTLNVYRTGNQHALEVEEAVFDYLADLETRLPAGIEVATWFNRADYLRGRLDLLMRNAWIGLILVFITLAVFLDLKLAFWTTLGIPISFMGGLYLMPFAGISINMLSLFALIIVLGIVVDDAIVVGENIFEYRQAGMDPTDAAIKGVREMAMPVTLAVATTIAAFAPLAFTDGMIGKITWVIPAVVSVVLAVSIIEALLILPAHLSSGRVKKHTGPIARGQARVGATLNWFITHVYKPQLAFFVRWRYATVATAVAMMLLIGGFLAAGHINFVFMPKVEADNVIATLEMPQGTPVERTRQVLARLEEAAFQVRDELSREGRGAVDEEGNELSVVKHMQTLIGELTPEDGPGAAFGGGGGGGHLGEVNVELLSSQKRDFTATEFQNLWRQAVGDVPGAQTLTFKSEFFSAGEAVNVELRHRDLDALARAVAVLKQELRELPGTADIRDTFETGKRELRFEMTPTGRAAGLNAGDIARQVRQAFYGVEVQRVQREGSEVKVMVRYPEVARESYGTLDDMRIRLADGTSVPLYTVANLIEDRGYATIRRTEDMNYVRVIADVDETSGNARQINKLLQAQVLPELQRQFPQLKYAFEGEEKERAESMASLGRNMVVAMVLIFGILAIQFRSYVQPLIVMSVIPFGLIGAVIGHLIMGYDLSFLSFMGVVALSGVVVNDSLIMVDLINRKRAAGESIRTAILESGARRFRPILLTTLTTFFGLMPMILETSVQAKFLIPMAISLGFGVLFATAITLILVPSLYTILEDVRELVTSRKATRAREPQGGRGFPVVQADA